jgi:two-component sensor histidine kinase
MRRESLRLHSYKYPFGEVLARESIGLYYKMVVGDIEKASEQYFTAIELCETHEIDYLADIFHALGVMFHTTDNYENAERYYQQSLEKAKAKGDLLLIKKCFINLGSLYSSLEDFVKAERYMKESLDLPVDPHLDYTTYANLGHLYVKQEKYGEAIPVLLKATKEAPDNPDADLHLYFLLYAKAMARDSSGMTEALTRAKRAAADERYGLRDKSLLYRRIADYLAFIGDYKEALFYRDKYIQVYEEIKEKQRDQVVLEMEAKYETEKKDAQLKLLALESEKKAQQTRLYSYLALAGLVIAGLIGFFWYKNREKNKLLTKQKVKLEENVEEINLLLREVHHRVKNNLQVVTSLLNIQQRSITDQKALEAIQESKNRIESMGLIHRSFYQNKNLGAINSREYIQNLVEQIFTSYQTDQDRIQLDLQVADLYLDMDTLVPLGLIINEMVSNSLKHAFKAKESGKLMIVLGKQEERYHLKIADNGAGLEDLADLERSASFGLKMVKAFVKKLNGSLTILPTEGATFQIEFTE